MWDNNHHRDFHTRVNAGKDQSTLEEEAYRQLLSNSLEADTEAAQRAGAHPACMCLLTYQATKQATAALCRCWSCVFVFWLRWLAHWEFTASKGKNAPHMVATACFRIVMRSAAL